MRRRFIGFVAAACVVALAAACTQGSGPLRITDDHDPHRGSELELADSRTDPSTPRWGSTTSIT